MVPGTQGRFTAAKAGRLAIIFTVFGITGILALLFSRLMLNGLIGMDGSLIGGPWSYRVVYVLLVPPFYSVTLIAVGTMFGQHEFFKRRVIRMWGRLLPFLRPRDGAN